MITEFQIIRNRQNLAGSLYSIIVINGIIYQIHNYYFNVKGDYKFQFIEHYKTIRLDEPSITEKLIEIIDCSSESSGYTKSEFKSYTILDELNLMDMISKNEI